ncbi:MAG: hypothetical protein RDU89_02665 [bacterium]|nr:hypothetical protein [bacterium]
MVSYLRIDAIDLVFLCRSTPFLKLQVARTGKPVYEAEPGLFAAFCSRAAREQGDGRVLERGADEYLRREIEVEPGG